eukprot:5114060-Prymnesium_polylepis.1
MVNQGYPCFSQTPDNQDYPGFIPQVSGYRRLFRLTALPPPRLALHPLANHARHLRCWCPAPRKSRSSCL